MNFTEHLKAEIFIPHNIFQEIEEGETLSHSYQETNATLIFLMITDTKSSTKYLEIKASKEYKDIRHHHEVRLIPGMYAWFNIQKLINVVHHMSRLKKKNLMIISTDANK